MVQVAIKAKPMFVYARRITEYLNFYTHCFLIKSRIAQLTNYGLYPTLSYLILSI